MDDLINEMQSIVGTGRDNECVLSKGECAEIIILVSNEINDNYKDKFKCLLEEIEDADCMGEISKILRQSLVM